MSEISKQCSNLVARYNATGKAEQEEFRRKLSEIEARIKRKPRNPILKNLFETMNKQFRDINLKEDKDMIKFTHKGKELACMPRIGATIPQVKACRQIVADRSGLGLYDIRLQFKN